MSSQSLKRLRYFANARSGIRKVAASPEKGLAERYLPTLGGKCVRPSGMPRDGYERRSHALVGARAFKAACRASLKKETAS